MPTISRTTWSIPTGGCTIRAALYTNPPGSGPPAYPAPPHPPQCRIFRRFARRLYQQELAYLPVSSRPHQRPNWSSRLNKFSTYVMNGAALGYRGTPPMGQKTHKIFQFKVEATRCGNRPTIPAVYNDAASQPNTTEGPSTRHPHRLHCDGLRRTCAAPQVPDVHPAVVATAWSRLV